jgi:hypothetical protein
MSGAPGRFHQYPSSGQVDYTYAQYAVAPDGSRRSEGAPTPTQGQSYGQQASNAGNASYPSHWQQYPPYAEQQHWQHQSSGDYPASMPPTASPTMRRPVAHRAPSSQQSLSPAQQAIAMPQARSQTTVSPHQVHRQIPMQTAQLPPLHTLQAHAPPNEPWTQTQGYGSSNRPYAPSRGVDASTPPSIGPGSGTYAFQPQSSPVPAASERRASRAPPSTASWMSIAMSGPAGPEAANPATPAAVPSPAVSGPPPGHGGVNFSQVSDSVCEPAHYVPTRT